MQFVGHRAYICVQKYLKTNIKIAQSRKKSLITTTNIRSNLKYRYTRILFRDYLNIFPNDFDVVKCNVVNQMKSTD